VQASCPQCTQRIVIEDAKVPDRPFAVRCPKCQATVRLPGKAAPAAAAGAPEHEAHPGPAPEDSRDLMAEVRRAMGPEEGGRSHQVLVAVPDRGTAGALTLPLTRLGFAVDTLDRPEEGGRMLEHGVYDVVITTRNAAIPGRGESLYQRLGRLAPDARRRIFLILVGDEYKTGDGLQAFVALADLVVNPRDASNVETLLLNTIAERSRLYQPYLDARRRIEASLG
jgi:predicted Zn finger-like uncharacterized protein